MSGHVVIAGGTGFVGQALAAELAREAETVVTLSRTAKPGSTVPWNAMTVGPWAQALEGAWAVVNLVGAPINRAWTAEARKAIVESRVRSTRAIGEAIAACKEPPRTWINASAVGIYGDRGAEELDDSANPGKGFLAEACVAWETAVHEAPTPKTRKVIARMGLALGHAGGVLPVLAKLRLWLLGGRVGSGRQYMSWIHVTDLGRMLDWLMEGDEEGVFNATSPEPVTNSVMMSTLGQVLSRPFAPPVPVLGLKLYRAVGGPPPELSLASQRVYPQRAVKLGFQFGHASLENALRDLLLVRQ